MELPCIIENPAIELSVIIVGHHHSGHHHHHPTIRVRAGTVSVLGNATILLMFHRRKSRLETLEYLLYNLTVSTLLMMSVTCPLNAASAFSHRWIFDELG